MVVGLVLALFTISVGESMFDLRHPLPGLYEGGVIEIFLDASSLRELAEKATDTGSGHSSYEKVGRHEEPNLPRQYAAKILRT